MHHNTHQTHTYELCISHIHSDWQQNKTLTQMCTERIILRDISDMCNKLRKKETKQNGSKTQNSHFMQNEDERSDELLFQELSLMGRLRIMQDMTSLRWSYSEAAAAAVVVSVVTWDAHVSPLPAQMRPVMGDCWTAVLVLQGPMVWLIGPWWHKYHMDWITWSGSHMEWITLDHTDWITQRLKSWDYTSP